MLNRLVIAQVSLFGADNPTLESVAVRNRIEKVEEEDGWTILTLENGWQLRFEHSGQLVIQPQVN